MIFLLRHTRPDVEAGICYGVTNLGLHPESYKADIAQAVENMGDINPSMIYSSPLKRCKIVAEAIAKGGKIIVDDRLKEMDFGEWEMLLWDDIFLTDEGKKWFDNYVETKTPKGESFEQMIERARTFLSEIAATQGDILVVTHAGFIRAAMVAQKMVSLHEAFDIKVEYGQLVKIGK